MKDKSPIKRNLWKKDKKLELTQQEVKSLLESFDLMKQEILRQRFI